MVRQNYNSLKFWENIIMENNTIRGHMFMQNPPKGKSLYIHTLIFSKSNGIDNIYAYFPDEKVLLGYIQYSFLPEAFYKWIHGKKKVITVVPPLSVEKIVKDGIKSGQIDKEMGKLMIDFYKKIEKMWDLPKDRLLSELSKFARLFNRTWYGDNTEFLYLKIFNSPEELGKFVEESTMITGSEEEFKNKIGVSSQEWKTICKYATKDENEGIKFKEILKKNLSEVI